MNETVKITNEKNTVQLDRADPTNRTTTDRPKPQALHMFDRAPGTSKDPARPIAFISADGRDAEMSSLGTCDASNFRPKNIFVCKKRVIIQSRDKLKDTGSVNFDVMGLRRSTPESHQGT